MTVYEEIGLPRVVNASGRVTVLGVSTISDKVAKAAVAGGQSYVVVEDLMDKAGEIISQYTGGEDSCQMCIRDRSRPPPPSSDSGTAPPSRQNSPHSARPPRPGELPPPRT